MYFEYVVVTDLETLRNVDVKYVKPSNYLMLRWSSPCRYISRYNGEISAVSN